MKFKKGNKKITDRSGFTIVEFMIYMAILSGFLVVLTNIFVSIVELKADTESVSAIEQDGRFIMARMMHDLHRASGVTIPAASGAASSSLTIVIGGVNYTYQLTGADLTLTNDTGTNRLNSSESKVSGLSFLRVGNAGGKPTVQIQFSVDSVTQRVSGQQPKSFIFSAGLR